MDWAVLVIGGWISLVVLYAICALAYSGYKDDELDWEAKENLEQGFVFMMALPFFLLLGAGLLIPFSVFGVGKLIRCGVEAYGRSKKDGT